MVTTHFDIMRSLILSLALCFLLPLNLLHARDILIPADDFPPWKIAKNGKIIGGIDFHLITALLDGLEFTPHYELLPWKRCLSIMESGDGDLISGVTMTKERQKYLTYLAPPYKTKSQKVLFVYRGMRTSFNTLKDMEHKTIGLLRGASYFPGFYENQAIMKYETNDDLQGMKMVAAGRLDGFLITKENGEYLLKENPQIKKNLEMSVWRYDKRVEVYFAISKKSKLIKRMDELETRLKYLVESGEIEKIINNSLN